MMTRSQYEQRTYGEIVTMSEAEGQWVAFPKGESPTQVAERGVTEAEAVGRLYMRLHRSVAAVK